MEKAWKKNGAKNTIKLSGFFHPLFHRLHKPEELFTITQWQLQLNKNEKIIN